MDGVAECEKRVMGQTVAFIRTYAQESPTVEGYLFPDRGERDKRDQTLEASLYVSQRKVGGAEHAAGSVTS